jgi:hypothetical protein
LNIEVYEQDPPEETEPQGGRDVSCTIYAPENDFDKENQTQEQPAKLQVSKAKKRKATKKKSKRPSGNDDAAKEPQAPPDQATKASGKPASKVKGPKGS